MCKALNKTLSRYFTKVETLIALRKFTKHLLRWLKRPEII